MKRKMTNAMTRSQIGAMLGDTERMLRDREARQKRLRELNAPDVILTFNAKLVQKARSKLSRLQRHRDKFVANKMAAEKGIEVTPDEVGASMRASLAKIRANMRAKGHDVPDGDEELLTLLREVQKARGK